MYEREIPGPVDKSVFEERFLEETGIPFSWAKQLAEMDNHLGEIWRKRLQEIFKPKETEGGE